MDSNKEEIVIEEFKTSTGKRTDVKTKKYKNYLIPAAYGVAFLLAVLAGMFLLDLPVVSVCVILVLEALIGVCLHDTPIWVHGIEIILNIVVGIIFKQTVFMIVGAGMYLVTILALYFMRKQEGKLWNSR